MRGPAGTGKTATAEVIASQMGIPLVTVYLDNLLNVYSAEEDVPSLREVFDRLARRRAVYLFDVFDTIGDDTSSGMIRRSEEHTSELQSRFDLVCRLLLEKKNE